MPQNRKPNVTVLGAGHGGQAMAAHLALKGYPVVLWNRTPQSLEAIRLRGGIRVTGRFRGFARLTGVTTDIAQALNWAEMVMVVVPAIAHRAIADACSLHLRSHHVVLLNPGRTGGALEFAEILRHHGTGVRPLLGEAQTFLYAARSTGPATVTIHGIKDTVPVAALPAVENIRLLEAVRQLYPQFVPAASVLKTGLDNIGAVFHPVISLLNAGWIERTQGDFRFYHDGVTPAVAEAVVALDQERLSLARVLGVKAVSARDWLSLAYGAEGSNFYQAVQNNQRYRAIRAPGTLDHRYLHEDVPTGLVPFSSLGQALGVDCPTIDNFIHLSSLLTGEDFRSVGRTLPRLGLAGKGVEEIKHYVTLGR
ncbi:MAG: NAD/NADP octopine/nopaline dehydrogenase family protein [Bacillota bacterium]